MARTTTNRLTRRYLDRVAVRADGACQDSELLRTAYGSGFLPRPVFLEAEQRDALSRDLTELHDLLGSLPDRLFGGDVHAMALAAGLDAGQARVVASSGDGRPVRLGRADLYQEPDGFRILEFNVSSALGGFENAEINRAVLGVPEVAAFVDEHRLRFHDTLSAIVDELFRDCPGLDRDASPVVAVVDWPSSYEGLARRLGFMADLLAGFGIEAIPCHAGQVKTAADGSLSVSGRRIDAVYRFVLIEDVLGQPGDSLFEPVLEAARRGTVALFSTFDSELFASKGNLALLQDERHREHFTQAERDFVARFVPPTRRVRDATVEWRGERTDLLRHARARREDLVLKPTAMHGGIGVVCGWTVGREEWERSLRDAEDGPFVLQERVRPVAEPVWGTGPDQETAVLNWGVFLGGEGFAGAIVRASVDPEVGIVSMGQGARVGCCFTPAP